MAAKFVQLDTHKFQELVMYIAQSTEDDPTTSLIRINKILYYSDFEAYRQFAEPITGACYRKFHEGPAPDYMADCVKLLTKCSRATLEQRNHPLGEFRYLKTNPKARQADTTIFTRPQLDIVDQAISYFKGKTPWEIVQLATSEVSWLEADFYQAIFYDHAWHLNRVPDQLDDLENMRLAAIFPVSPKTQ